MSDTKSIGQYKIMETEVEGSKCYLLECKLLGDFEKIDARAVPYKDGIVIQYKNKQVYKVNQMPKNFILTSIKNGGFLMSETNNEKAQTYPVFLKEVKK